MTEAISASIARKLQTNFVLRIVLSVAFVCLWAAPLFFRNVNGSSIEIGQLYAIAFRGLLSGSIALFAGFMTLLFTRRRLLAGKTENVERRLKTNFVLRIILAATFVCVWAMPLVFRTMYGSSVEVGDLYAACWSGLLYVSLALVGGFLALQFTKNKVAREMTVKTATPAAGN